MIINKMYLSVVLLLILALCRSQSVTAQGLSPAQETMPFSKLITAKAAVTRGMMTIYTQDNHYYLQINDSVLNRPIMILNRILESSTAIKKREKGYAGDEIGETHVLFEKSGKKIFIRDDVFANRSLDSSENGAYKAIKKNILSPIRFSFDIKAFGPDSVSAIIDVTDLITGNSNLLAGEYKDMAFQSDKSYIEQIRSFPINTEIKSVKTYGTGKEDSTITVRLNTSFILLPARPMHERFADKRVGYFTPYNIDFDSNPEVAGLRLKIARWRLEVKPEDIEKYRKGILVEPVKPIVFYIDPATPKAWVPYLIQGVNDWQKAFEKAGFKNAIMGREVTAADSNWSIDDARYSVIVYKPSLFANAMGPNVSDWRTGEIMGSHVSWYHNVMTLLHNWYFLQAGIIDTNARKREYSTELMGQLIRFVSSHEIGHTLGLTHNFGSSSTVPVDSLRNKKWVELHGHTPSIMDYARFNYVAQPEDHISERGIFPRIGDYDKWAIEWGYRCYPDIKDMNAERHLLFNMLTDSLRKNPRLYYGESGFLGIVDARCQSEDLSDDVVTANTYGLKNLKSIIQKLPEWTFQNDDMFGLKSGNGLWRSYAALLLQFSTYQMHIVNNIGLAYYNNIAISDSAKVYMPVPKVIQQRSMAFLNKQIFSTEPEWIVPGNITRQVWSPANGMIPEQASDEVLSQLLVFYRLIALQKAAMTYGEATYTLIDFLADLDKGIWSDLQSPVSVGAYHRFLQQRYINMLIMAVKQIKDSDTPAIIRAHLSQIKLKIKKILPLIKDKTTKYHYDDILIQLDGLST